MIVKEALTGAKIILPNCFPDFSAGGAGAAGLETLWLSHGAKAAV
jgi:hypothetical protein